MTRYCNQSNLLFVLLALFLLPQVSHAGSSTEVRPNILFVLADDLGHGDIQALRKINHATPNELITGELDRMSREGMVLNRHYTAAPVCAPARGSLLTGLHQGHAGIRNNMFDKPLEDHWNLANTLKAAGYYTALVGKYGLQGWGGEANVGSQPSEWEAYPTKRGFDYFYGAVRHRDGHLHYPAHYWEMGDTSPNHTDPKEIWENNEEVSKGLDKCYSTDLFGARAKQLMIERTQAHPDQPFFIFLALTTPHAALQVASTPYPEGGGLTGGLQWIGEPGHMINTATGIVDGYYHPAYREMDRPDEHRRFASMVTRIDQLTGDLLQTIRDLGIAENTIVVFSSDNGPHTEHYIDGGNYDPTAFESFGSFQGEKRDVLEGGYRVPTIAWGPGMVQPGAVNNHPSQFHDWMATFIDFAGLSVPARIDGVSLRPTLMGSGVQEPGIVYTEYSVGSTTPDNFEFHSGRTRNQQQSIYLDGFKGIREGVTDHQIPFRIYDTLNDAKESVNLAALPENDPRKAHFEALAARMKAEVLRIRQPHPTEKRAYDDAFVPGVAKEWVKPTKVYRFEGHWDWVPRFRKEDHISSDTVESLDVSHLSRTKDAGLLYEGFIHVDAPGKWTFESESDAGVVLKIHNSLVVDDHFKQDQGEVSGSILLEAGYHPFKLYYRSKHQEPMLNLRLTGPNGVRQKLIPVSL